MKEKIKKYWWVIIVVLVLGGTLYWFLRQNYQTKMIKLNACYGSCQKCGGFLYPNCTKSEIQESKSCPAKCLEKYGVEFEELNQWQMNRIK